MNSFPHLKDTRFPDLGNVDVYKYQNEFDYARYDAEQMDILLCSVPWDMGEAHVGNRTISGIGNVVYFGSEEKRDEWFNSITDDRCYRFETKYRQLHRDNEITVPVPFDAASKYNYLVVRYKPFATDGDYVQYETGDGLNEWFWFIREVEFIAPNATKLHLLNDAFQTFIYRLNVTGMVLERGHAPLFETMADKYLLDPVNNNAGLLTEDVNYGRQPSRVQTVKTHVFNSNTYACFAVSSNVKYDSWGSKDNDDWICPASYSYTIDGVPTFYVFAMATSDLNSFLSNIKDDYPQFLQSVKGVFFAPQELVSLGTKFTFANIDCYPVSSVREKGTLLTLTKSLFKFDDRYKELAKLYTSPYSHIEVTDENGNVIVVNVEDISGNKLDFNACMSLSFPAIQVQAHLLNVGGSNLTLSFKNISEKSLTIGGKWYETLCEWDVPLFGVVLSGTKHNDYATHFTRAQQKISYDNEYDSAIASATAQSANTKASAATANTNANNRAGVITDNAALQATCNNSLTSAGNTLVSSDFGSDMLLNLAATAAANSYTSASANNQIQMTEATAAASQAANVANTAIGAASNLGTGDIGGALSAVASGIVSGVTLQATTEAGVNYTSAQASASNGFNSTKCAQTNSAGEQKCTNAKTAANSRRDASNALTTGSAANSAACMIANASNDKTTADANADRTYNAQSANATRAKNTAQNEVSNSIKQARLEAPYEFGEISHTDNATTKPMALIANVVTQAQNAIKAAGDEFLRYGYMYDQYWEFDGDWNIGKKFTYWKLRDFWVSGLNIPDMYVDKIRFFLFGGVTVWRKPEDIGNTTIYENL